MSVKKEEWIHRDYDHQKQAYVIDKYEDGILVCTYNGYLNHRTRTFKCYPRRLGTFEPLRGVSIVHENDVRQAYFPPRENTQ